MNFIARGKRRISGISAITAGVVLVGFATSAWAQTYHLTDLGTLGGGTSSANALNNLGQVVGQSETADGQSHAFLLLAATSLLHRIHCSKNHR